MEIVKAHTLFWQVSPLPQLPQLTFEQPLKMVPQFRPCAEHEVVGLQTQSESTPAVHPTGQHPSPPWHEVMFEKEHCAEQVAAAPVSVSRVQALLSLQVVGQFPSQTSPVSTVPFPQVVLQSASVALVHPAGQHPSPPVQAVREMLVH